MKSNPEPSTQELIAGLVERVTFHLQVWVGFLFW